MSSLEKWFPFKFRRQDEKKTAETSASTGQSTGQSSGQVPATTSHRPGFSTPMGQLVARMFDDPFFTRPLLTFGLGDVERFFGDFAPTAFSPSVDVVDEGKHVKVTAELPGLDKGDIKLSLDDGMLTIDGEKKHEERKQEEGCYHTERYYGRFRRTVPLPVDVDLDSAEAKFEKGVLSVRFAKVERPEKQRTIKVA